MLNIISRSIVSKRVSGPRKVVENLIKGLDEIGYPYVINARLDACQRVWIHDDIDALREVVKYPAVCAVVGPNLYVSIEHIPKEIDLSKTLYLHPSQWVVDMWLAQSFKRAPLAPWPTGIDSATFTPSVQEKKHVLIYFKERYPEELAYAKNLLEKLQLPYEVILYGSYTESAYQALLAEAKYVLWIGRQESQGIALQEAMATNTPILVWDVPCLGHWQSSPKTMAVFSDLENNFTAATSAPYFDNSCGMIIEQKADLESRLLVMEESYTSYEPRLFIENHLSLEKQARDFIRLFDTQFGLSFEAGLTERILREGVWKNAALLFRMKQYLKDGVKKFLK